MNSGERIGGDEQVSDEARESERGRCHPSVDFLSCGCHAAEVPAKKVIIYRRPARVVGLSTGRLRNGRSAPRARLHTSPAGAPNSDDEFDDGAQVPAARVGRVGWPDSRPGSRFAGGCSIRIAPDPLSVIPGRPAGPNRNQSESRRPRERGPPVAPSHWSGAARRAEPGMQRLELSRRPRESGDPGRKPPRPL